MRVAIAHYWLLNMRGGEKVLEALCRLLPQADLFTLFYEPQKVSEIIRSRRVTASFLNPGRRFYRSLLPLMPLALESLDLRDYDLVISSESGPAKGVLTRTGTRHVCYCHTPMRYLWQLYPDYLHDWTPAWKRGLMAPIANYLRLWDYSTAARVDEFVANSENVRRRIWHTYRREAEVVYPPVDVQHFTWAPPGDFYLSVGELVAYKRLDYAVRWFSTSGRRLKIVGSGPEYQRLRTLAGPNVEFCGHVSDSELYRLYAQCRALLLPGEEDFGITAVEATASGKPVIALGRGGVLDSVPPEGLFAYEMPTAADLAAAVEAFEAAEAAIPAEALQRSAARFSEAAFTARMHSILRLEQPPTR
ncbi:MAG: glycosyltransferase [Acidobacteria bacterium]|nr:glycosyltransferase [Acidobacteriota bacterium]